MARRRAKQEASRETASSGELPGDRQEGDRQGRDQQGDHQQGDRRQEDDEPEDQRQDQVDEELDEEPEEENEEELEDLSDKTRGNTDLSQIEAQLVLGDRLEEIPESFPVKAYKTQVKDLVSLQAEFGGQFNKMQRWVKPLEPERGAQNYWIQKNFQD